MFPRKFGNKLRTPSVCLVLMGLLLGCGKERTPILTLIPEGYTGWLKVCYDHDGAPPIKEDNGFLIFEFDSTGKILTSSSLEEGWANDEYFYYKESSRKELFSTGWGGGGMIWGGYTENQDGRICSGSFVGTEKQFKERGIAEDRLPGNLKLN